MGLFSMFVLVGLMGFNVPAFAQKQPTFKVQTCEFDFQGVVMVEKRDKVNFCTKLSFENYQKGMTNSKAPYLGDGYKLIENGKLFVALNPKTMHVIPLPVEFEMYEDSTDKGRIYYKLNAKKQICFSTDGSLSSLDYSLPPIDLGYDKEFQKGICFSFNKKDGFYSRIKKDIVDYKTMKAW